LFPADAGFRSIGKGLVAGHHISRSWSPPRLIFWHRRNDRRIGGYEDCCFADGTGKSGSQSNDIPRAVRINGTRLSLCARYWPLGPAAECSAQSVTGEMVQLSRDARGAKLAIALAIASASSIGVTQTGYWQAPLRPVRGTVAVHATLVTRKGDGAEIQPFYAGACGRARPSVSDTSSCPVELKRSGNSDSPTWSR
jgi:hypothetical protein